MEEASGSPTMIFLSDRKLTDVVEASVVSTLLLDI